MREIGAFEAKNRLGALLDRVENGEEIVITRRGKPVAKLGPAARLFGWGFANRRHRLGPHGSRELIKRVCAATAEEKRWRGF